MSDDYGMRVPLEGGPLDGDELLVSDTVRGILLRTEGGWYSWGHVPRGHPGAFEATDDDGSPMFVVVARFTDDPMPPEDK